MARSLVSVVLSCLIVGAVATSAQAQTEPPPGGAAPAAGGGSRGSASAGHVGVGGILYLSGVPGLSVAYDAGPWHIDTLLGLSGDNPNIFQIGGRFWFHVHSVGSADLSVGAGAAYQHQGSQGMNAALSFLFIEAGGLIRVFLVQNVALGAGAGIVFGTADASGYSLGSNNGNPSLTGSAALHYYF